MKWYERTSWINKSAGSAASNAASALAEGKRAVERARLEAELKREAEARQRQQEINAKKAAEIEQNKMNLYHAARRKAAEQLKSFGYPVTPEYLKKQLDSKFSWVQQEFRAGQQKMRADVIEDLLDEGVINYEMPQEDMEIFIQGVLKRKYAENALKAGRPAIARELQAEADWIMENRMLPPLPGVEIPVEEMERRFQQEVGELPWYKRMAVELASGKAEIPKWFPWAMPGYETLQSKMPEAMEKVDLPFKMAQHAEVLRLKGGQAPVLMSPWWSSRGKEEYLTEDEKKFLEQYDDYNRWSNMGQIFSPPKELRDLYYEITSTPQEIVQSFITPTMAALSLLPAGTTVKGARAVPKAVQAETRITRTLVTETAERPGGGKAWELYDKLFDVEPVEETIKRLYPRDWEAKMAELAGKAPGGKGTVRLINPSVTPRETLEAQRAQEAVAVYLDRTVRRSGGVEGVAEAVIRAEIPKADAVKLFDIDAKGIQHAFKPKAGYEKASPAIVDVMEHPYKWELNEPAQKLSTTWGKIREAAVKNLEQRGIRVNKKFYEEGAGYFPRMVREAHGEPIAYPKVRFEKPRTYQTQLEAIDNNVIYTRDPIENIKSFIRHTNELIAAQEFQETVNVIGRTPKDVIPTSLIVGRDKAVALVRNLDYAQKMVRRIKRGEAIPEVSLKAIERKTPEFGKDARKLTELSGQTKIAKANQLIKDINSRLPKAKLDAAVARKTYTKALETARAPRLGEFEKGTKHPLFRGRIFPQEVADVLDEFTFKRPDLVWKATQTVASTLRTLVAAMDFSPMFIQGLAMLGRMPARWALVTKEAFNVLFHPANAPKWMARAENVGIRMRHPDILKGTFEYYEALPQIARIPIVGKPISKAYSPFERFFTFWGDAARTEIAKALEPGFIRAGEAEKLGTYVNRMTGVMETRALGVGATQRAIETSWVFFAPRYTRACMAYVGDLFKGGIVGHEARRSLGQMAAGGAIMYAAVAKVLGQEPHFDPRYPDFMTIQVGNRNVGMGGFYYSFLRFLADLTSSVIEDGPAKRQDFLSLSRKDNPFIKFMYNRASPLTGLTVEAIQRRDYLGQPFETPQDWAHWLFVEHMMPIALQEMVPAPGEEAPSRIPEILLAEEFGLRTFPKEPFYELRDKYAQQIFGQNWGDLYEVDKNGVYRISKKHKFLLNYYPDLKEAYDKWHVKASARWRAEHNL